MKLLALIVMANKTNQFMTLETTAQIHHVFCEDTYISVYNINGT